MATFAAAGTFLERVYGAARVGAVASCGPLFFCVLFSTALASFSALIFSGTSFSEDDLLSSRLRSRLNCQLLAENLAEATENVHNVIEGISKNPTASLAYYHYRLERAGTAGRHCEHRRRGGAAGRAGGPAIFQPNHETLEGDRKSVV